MLSVFHKMEAHDGEIMNFLVRCSIIAMSSRCLKFCRPRIL